MQVYQTKLLGGITRTKEFERKKLASFAVNVGTKCGHDCLYCSTGALLRMHRSFKEVGRSPFGHGYAIVDPSTPERVSVDARRIRHRGLVQLCTIVDAWAPEAQAHQLGRRCLEAILSEPGWSVRILTKNASVIADYDLVAQHRDRVLVGLSITGTAENEALLRVIEPNASTITERISAMERAKALGLRTFGMFCPLIPGVADTPEQVDQLIRLAAAWCVEEVFVEPVNQRGPGLRLTQDALEQHDYHDQALAIKAIRQKKTWSAYVVRLLNHVQHSMRQHLEIGRLRFLLYPSGLTPEDAQRIRSDDSGVVWLDKAETPKIPD
ncbi:MAG: radical SAM protein [Planctomycetota bacterium]